MNLAGESGCLASSAATTLRLKWILVSRVVAHQFSQNREIWQTMETLGFKRLEITDGYDEQWYWTID